jgi:hypothetical protein
VLCSTPNEETLRRAAAGCELKGIRNYLFCEPDLGGQATAFATEPIYGEARKAFKKYPLWNAKMEVQHDHA